MSDTVPLRVMSARAVHVAVGTLADAFTAATGRQTDIVYAPVGVLQDKLAGGETADVLILTAAALDRLDQAGALVPDSRALLGRTAIGVAAPAGAAPPDITTPEAFRATLLAARAIALSDPAVGGTAGVYLRGLFERMGLADAIGAKAKPQPSGAAVAQCVARGEAEIGMTFISEMLPIPGVTIVGALPAPLGTDTAYVAAVTAGCAEVATAQAFIAALTRPDRRDVWQAAGFDRP